MKSIILLALFLVLCATLANAQAPDTLWTKVYGSQENDHAREVEQTADDNPGK